MQQANGPSSLTLNACFMVVCILLWLVAGKSASQVGEMGTEALIKDV
jgi:hypothetical protein